MKTIHKFQLELDDETTVMIPHGAQILSADHQNGFMVVWALVDTTMKPTERKFRIVGTGHPFPDHLQFEFVNTVQWPGDLVFHVFVSP